MEEEDTTFNSFIELANLFGIQTSNGIYTLNHRRGEKHQEASKLDHFLLSEALVMYGMHIDACMLPSFKSDHCPITLQHGLSSFQKN